MNPLKKSKRNFKRQVAIITKIPTTKSGRKRKADKIQGQGIVWLVIIGAIVYAFSGKSNATLIVGLF